MLYSRYRLCVLNGFAPKSLALIAFLIRIHCFFSYSFYSLDLRLSNWYFENGYTQLYAVVNGYLFFWCFRLLSDDDATFIDKCKISPQKHEKRVKNMLKIQKSV